MVFATLRHSRHGPRGFMCGAILIAVSGCGLAQQATNTALTPVASAANLATGNLQLVTNTISAGVAVNAASMGQSLTTASSAFAQASAPLSQALASPAVQSTMVTPQQAATLTQLQQLSQSQSVQPSKPSDPELDILPPDVLKKLNKDQARLQKTIQSIAFKAAVGKEASWYAQGRSGSAVAESEDYLGFFLCRSFVQTVTLDGTTSRAQGLACRNDDGTWSLPF
jgi:surface antigen